MSTRRRVLSTVSCLFVGGYALFALREAIDLGASVLFIVNHMVVMALSVAMAVVPWIAGASSEDSP